MFGPLRFASVGPVSVSVGGVLGLLGLTGSPDGRGTVRRQSPGASA